MSPKHDLARAAELIKQKRYKEAKRILITLDHPKAAEWLKKIDDMELGDPFQQRPVRQGRGWGRAACGIFLVLLLVAIIGWVIIGVQQSGNNAQATIDAIDRKYGVE